MVLSKSSTVITSAGLFIITLSVLQLYAKQIAAEPRLQFLGGFISSLLFFFGLIAIGNLEIRRETKWAEVIVALVLAMFAAGTVHPVCITTCFIFSVVLLIWMNSVAKYYQQRGAVTSPASQRARTKNA